MGTSRINALDSEIAQSTNSSTADMRYCDIAAIHAVVDVSTPAAIEFTAAASDLCTTATAHGFKTGLKVQVSTSAGDLPAGLTTSTDYFVIYVSALTFKLASSLALANAGTAVDITDAGTGTHTITATSIAGALVKAQGSNDNENFVDISGATSNITADGSILINVADIGYRWFRAAYVMTAGQMIVDTYITGKERCN